MVRAKEETCTDPLLLISFSSNHIYRTKALPTLYPNMSLNGAQCIRHIDLCTGNKALQSLLLLLFRSTFVAAKQQL